MRSLKLVLILCLSLIASLPAAPAFSQEQEAKTFAVAPFAVNGPDKYAYFSRGIQDMLVSRLQWQEHLEHVGRDEVSGAVKAPPATEQEAAAALAKLGADYLVWGSVTILGEEASVDMRVTGEDGRTWPKSAQTGLTGLIPALDALARQANAEIFGKPAEAEAPAKETVTRLNPELLYNESVTQEYHINPQFRYEGGPETPGRWRSQALPFTAAAMVAGDVDADGVTELVFADENDVTAYRYREGRLEQVATISPLPRGQIMSMNLMDANRDGFSEIVVSAVQDGMPESFVLNLKDNAFTVVEKNVRMYLSVAKLPPTFTPVLVGQKGAQGARIFDSGVFEIVRMDGEYKTGKRIPLPDKANVFNFAFLPTEDGYKILLIDPQDHIEVYTPTLELQAETSSAYAGSSLGFEVADTFGGFSERKGHQYTVNYYIPLRIVTVNLDGKGDHEIVVNRNISTAAQFFQRYRFFPEGELHSLFWDGVGLSLSWKTRRIKGSVADYGIADVDNDGRDDLYACVLTYPGISGFKERKTLLIAYTLDLSSAQKDLVPVDLQDDE
jgi:hypothetical protein